MRALRIRRRLAVVLGMLVLIVVGAKITHQLVVAPSRDLVITEALIATSAHPDSNPQVRIRIHNTTDMPISLSYSDTELRWGDATLEPTIHPDRIFPVPIANITEGAYHHLVFDLESAQLENAEEFRNDLREFILVYWSSAKGPIEAKIEEFKIERLRHDEMRVASVRGQTAVRRRVRYSKGDLQDRIHQTHDASQDRWNRLHGSLY